MGSYDADCVAGKSTIDEPPKIVTLWPARLNDPKSFVQIGNVSSTNTLNCEADNADKVEWQYSEDGIMAYSAAAVPSHLNRERIEKSLPCNNRIGSVLDDNGQFRDQKARINGFYRCTATNTQGKGYTAIVPPVRIIFGCKYSLCRPSVCGS